MTENGTVLEPGLYQYHGYRGLVNMPWTFWSVRPGGGGVFRVEFNHLCLVVESVSPADSYDGRFRCIVNETLCWTKPAWGFLEAWKRIL